MNHTTSAFMFFPPSFLYFLNQGVFFFILSLIEFRSLYLFLQINHPFLIYSLWLLHCDLTVHSSWEIHSKYLGILHLTLSCLHSCCFCSVLSVLFNLGLLVFVHVLSFLIPSHMNLKFQVSLTYG